LRGPAALLPTQQAARLTANAKRDTFKQLRTSRHVSAVVQLTARSGDVHTSMQDGMERARSTERNTHERARVAGAGRDIAQPHDAPRKSAAQAHARRSHRKASPLGPPLGRAVSLSLKTKRRGRLSVHYSSVQYAGARCPSVQYASVRYSSVQYVSVQYSSVSSFKRIVTARRPKLGLVRCRLAARTNPLRLHLPSRGSLAVHAYYDCEMPQGGRYLSLPSQPSVRELAQL
jgi:hypothetical protein